MFPILLCESVVRRHRSPSPSPHPFRRRRRRHCPTHLQHHLLWRYSLYSHLLRYHYSFRSDTFCRESHLVLMISCEMTDISIGSLHHRHRLIVHCKTHRGLIVIARQTSSPFLRHARVQSHCDDHLFSSTNRLNPRRTASTMRLTPSPNRPPRIPFGARCQFENTGRVQSFSR